MKKLLLVYLILCGSIYSQEASFEIPCNGKNDGDSCYYQGVNGICVSIGGKLYCDNRY